MANASESLMRRLMREPTVHFVVLAALLFVAAAIVKQSSRPVVEIDRRNVDARIQQIERGRGRPLDAGERALAEAAYVDEQILAREARARGFDDDERIRAILYQKMLHILSGDVPQPTDVELNAFFDANRDRYVQRPAVTVEDVFVPSGVARAASVRVLGDADPAALTRQEGSRSGTLTRVTEGELAWSFGDATASKVFRADAGAWVGPHRSDDGDHWFRIVEHFGRTEAPPLASIREQVRFDWMAQKEEALLAQRIAEMRKRYAVRIDDVSVEP